MVQLGRGPGICIPGSSYFSSPAQPTSMGLNPAQEEAIRNSGIQLILAGPGSGKTRVITEKVFHLLGEGVPPREILALTFSDKAAQEMRDRLEQKTDISDLSVQTFHSFCLQVLQDNVLDSGISFTSGVISRTNQLVWGLKNLDSFGFEHIEVGNKPWTSSRR